MVNETKRCPKCKETKSIEEFYLNIGRLDGLSPYCVECSHVSQLAGTRKIRAELLALFGGVCERCGFDDPRALQVDHVNGDGHIDRQNIYTNTRKFIKHVRDNREDYQLLCANHNVIKVIEDGEHKPGGKIRTIPTADRIKKPYVGKGNSEAGRAALERARTPEHQKDAANARWANA